MKTHLLVLFTAVFSLQAVWGQNSITRDENIRYDSYTKTDNDGNVIGERTVIFNADKQPLKVVTKDMKEGVLFTFQEEEYTYKNGKRSSYLCKSARNSLFELIMDSSTDYNDDGLPLIEKRYRPSNVQTLEGAFDFVKTVYTYEGKYLISKQIFSRNTAEENYQERELYSYRNNSQGLQIEVIWKQDGIIREKNVFDYEEQGRVKLRQRYTATGPDSWNLIMSEEVSYNDADGIVLRKAREGANIYSEVLYSNKYQKNIEVVRFVDLDRDGVWDAESGKEGIYIDDAGIQYGAYRYILQAGSTPENPVWEIVSLEYLKQTFYPDGKLKEWHVKNSATGPGAKRTVITETDSYFHISGDPDYIEYSAFDINKKLFLDKGKTAYNYSTWSTDGLSKSKMKDITYFYSRSEESVHLQCADMQNARYSVSSLSGGSVAEGIIDSASAVLPLKGFAPGVYVVNVISGTERNSFKIVKD